MVRLEILGGTLSSSVDIAVANLEWTNGLIVTEKAVSISGALNIGDPSTSKLLQHTTLKILSGATFALSEGVTLVLQLGTSARMSLLLFRHLTHPLLLEPGVCRCQDSGAGWWQTEQFCGLFAFER